MSRYVSDRSCPVHGAPVERYLKDNRCCDCHMAAVKRSNRKRADNQTVCRRCGTSERSQDGRCVKCFDEYLKSPCPICGERTRDGAGKCLSCTKPLFYRKVPSDRRRDMRAFIQAINLEYGVTTGDMSWAGLKFDSKHHEPIIKYLLTLKG